MISASLVLSLLAAAPAFEVALLCTQPQGETTELYFQRAGQGLAAEPAARLQHRRGAEVKGALLPGTRTVLAVADYARVRDLSFGSALFRLEPGRPQRLLAEGLYYATRPLVTAQGRVFIQRGKAGPEPTPEQAALGMLREDELTVDEIDPSTGALRTVHSFRGYIAFLAGALNDRLFLYRVSFRKAELLELDANTGAVRTLQAQLAPFARDFAVDEATGSLLYTQLDEATGRWIIERQSLANLERTRLAEGPAPSLAASPWPGGKLAYNPGGRDGLAIFEDKRAPAPLGPGVDFLRGFSKDLLFAFGLHTVAGELPLPFVLEVATKRAFPLPFPAGTRVDAAGLVESALR